MTVFSANGLSKTFDDKLLFENVSFGMQEGERVGIIGKNGAGKTTLMRILASMEVPDTGEVIFNNNARLEFLEQMPDFDKHDSVLDVVMKGKPQVCALLDEYQLLCGLPKEQTTPEQEARLEELSHKIDEADGWNLENQAKAILSQLSLTEYDKDVMKLSGGLKKRAALARALLSKPDLLILDEPTNHLDADSVQWLQDYLQNSNQTILFVTHDRYFLDAIVTRIVEIDQEKIFTYPGSYEQYLERKHEYMQVHQSTVDHKLSRLKTELAWLQKGAKARRTKQSSRINWIDELKKEAVHIKEKKIKIELGCDFISSRVIEAHSIKKTIGGKLLFNDFTYYAKPKDRIGIIGPNGSGKSTLLKTLQSIIQPDSGTVKIGTSIRLGYFKQEIDDLKPEQSVIGAVKEISEYINVGVGRDRYLTPQDLLDKFLFQRRQQKALIKTLSGGEKRRLGLVRLLMGNPNVLLLDEPTNDFDLATLTAFEEYLDDFYGVLITVSHDRAFLDRTVEFIYCFDGKGNIKQYPGNYSFYLQKKEQEKRNAVKTAPSKNDTRKNRPKQQKKLSYKEQREFDELEIKIPELENAKETLESELASGTLTDFQVLQDKSDELQRLNDEIDESSMRWLELAEKVN